MNENDDIKKSISEMNFYGAELAEKLGEKELREAKEKLVRDIALIEAIFKLPIF